MNWERTRNLFSINEEKGLVVRSEGKKERERVSVVLTDVLGDLGTFLAIIEII